MNNSWKLLPGSPGVYLFKNNAGKVLYVGKAINLRARVASYFAKNVASEKVSLLVSEADRVDHIKVASEIEALLLEANLIKKYQPYYNHQLKDDKDYLYIIITKEDYPRVITGRKRDLVKSKSYFGPFPSSNAARGTLRTVRHVFPFRTTCKPGSPRACLASHLGLCPGVCAGLTSRIEYQKILRKLVKFLQGDTKEVLKDLEKDMKTAAAKLEFEQAAKIKTKIEAITQTTRPIETVERYLEGPQVLDSIYERQLESLTTALNLNEKPNRIECYDISNTSGTNSTGSMVVLINGQVSKDDYRRFKIKTVKGPNDFASMREVLTRRFRNSWPLPDLMIIDGGKGQLGVAVDVLKELNLNITVVGLAKKLEEIYRPGVSQSLRLPKDSPALLLVQRIRDESHRFAITYHRYLRSKAFLSK